ncbi:MAG: 30S ribosomal protein S8 [Candidatus Competibacteraceae bacterium]|nr:30S ribosomal protein S8 [Candidatus Competibacteraceae bacterium]
MSMTDPIADMLTRIRNAQAATKTQVIMPSSTVKVAIAEVLKQEGYIADFSVAEADNKRNLTILLRYYLGKPVIAKLQRISRPGLRVFKGKSELPKVMGGLGVAIISTSQGVVSDRAARAAGYGGEVLCIVA